MTKEIKLAVIFGTGLAIGLAIGSWVLTTAKRVIS
jgi:hypothetical protein